MRTVFEYLYRDASNYKAWGSLLLEGIASSSQIEELRALMDERRYFIPQQVGAPPLQEQLYEYSRGPTEDDHVWHEFFGACQKFCV